MATLSGSFITPAQYLARERAASTRSEYFRGEMFAMAGATETHVLIVTNLVAELKTRLRPRGCRIYSNDMRLLVPSTGLYTYPDVMVVCGKPVFADERTDTLTNPLLIIEVLSESTKDYDRGGKFEQYKQVPSLQQYLTISQTEMLVNSALRQPGGSWLPRDFSPPSGDVPLVSMEIELAFADIYDYVTFTPSA